METAKTNPKLDPKLETVEIQIDSIEIHPDVPNIRTKIRKDDIKDLMSSIKESGLKSPITVFEEGEKYFLVSGERRLESFRELSKEDPKKYKTITAIVQKYEDISQALFDNTIENIQREDVNGFDLAKRIQMLLDKGIGKNEITKRLGKSITWVNDALKLLSADPEVQKQVADNNITFDEGKKIAKLPQDVQSAVAESLATVKSSGNKKATRTLKKSIDQATRVRSSVMPGKKEISANKEKLFKIIEAMKKTDDKDSKQYYGLQGVLMALRWVVGEETELKLDGLMKKYGIKEEEKKQPKKPKEPKEPKDKKPAKKPGGKRGRPKKTAKKD